MLAGHKEKNMIPVTLNLKTILGIENLEQFKFHAARNNRYDEPLDVFLRDRDEWDSWNSWQGGETNSIVIMLSPS